MVLNALPAVFVDASRRTCIAVSKDESRVKLLRMKESCQTLSVGVESIPLREFNKEFSPLIDYPVRRAAHHYLHPLTDAIAVEPAARRQLENILNNATEHNHMNDTTANANAATNEATKPTPKGRANGATKPASKAAAKPTAKVAAKPATKPAAKPAAKGNGKAAAKPTAAKLVRGATATKPAAKPTSKPAASAKREPAAGGIGDYQESVNKLLRRKEGASVAECVEGTGLCKRSVRKLIATSKAKETDTRGRYKLA
jgi:hypothetical protein